MPEHHRHLRHHRPGRVAACLLAVAAALLPAGPAAAQRAGGMVQAARADLADAAAGRYVGRIAAAGETERPLVRIVVARIGPNRIRVTSDDPRLPGFTAGLVRAMATIRGADGGDVFQLDLSKRPPMLGVTAGGLAWSGSRE